MVIDGNDAYDKKRHRRRLVINIGGQTKIL